MQVLPHHEKAVVPLEKLRDYALDPNHPVGKNKARVFKSALGMERGHADVLAEILKASLSRSPAVRGLKQEYGDHWITYHEIVGLSGNPVVVTAVWIYRVEQVDVPVLISCYIEPQGPKKLAEARSAE